jgi:hypothetical protein
MPLTYDTIPPRPPEYGNGITTEYRGFVITDRFTVSKDGKVIWDDNISLQQCKSIIDQSLAVRVGNSVSRDGEEELENGSQAAADFADRVNDYFENEIWEGER